MPAALRGGSRVSAKPRARKPASPNTRPQALLDKLVITGLCALHWKAPALYGADRDRWKLPQELGPVKVQE